jgi:hypothetical protein
MDKLDKIISIVHSLKEDMGAGAIANVTNNPSKPVNIAGLPPDMPPVDLRKGKRRNWNPFFKNLAKIQKRKPPKM